MNQGFARILGGVSLLAALTLATPVAAQSLGICFTGTGPAAIADCTRKIDSGQIRGKALAMAYYNRGYEFKNLGYLDLAIVDFNESIKFNPSYARAYMHRGDAHRKLEDFKLAIADFDRALQIDPKDEFREYAVEGRDKARQKIKN